MGRIISAASFMTAWGIFWGGLLGALSGTLIYPFFGTMYSVTWGLGLGAALGVVTGILLGMVFRPHEAAPDETRQRRQLTQIAGIVTALGAPALLMATTYDFLWGGYSGNSMLVFFIPSMVAACAYGGLAAANTAHRLMTRAAGPDSLRDFGDALTTFRHFAARATNRWVFVLAALAGCGLALFNAVSMSAYTANPYNPAQYYTTTDYLRIGVEYAIAGVVVAAAVILLLSLGLGALIGFLNRIFFMEYVPHWPMERYRVAVMLLAGTFTLVAGALVTLLIGAPFAAVYAAVIARSYAERYYAMQGKPKRKARPMPQEELALSAE